MALNGWPFANEAAKQRNFETLPNQIDRQAMLIPRGKFTWLVQFDINPAVFTDEFKQTNLAQFIQNGKLYIHIRQIDLPKVQFETEKIRAYNHERIITKKLEYPACSMHFFDDATSMVTALIKEYMNFMHETGDIGKAVARGESVVKDNAKYSAMDSAIPRDQMRSEMATRPSLGMKLHADGKRTFFDNIVVYNLGTDPDSINIYYFYKPVLTTIDHDILDYEDRSMKLGANFSFEYESFYFTLGQPRGGDNAAALHLFDPDAETNEYYSTDHALMYGSDSGTFSDPVSYLGNALSYVGGTGTGGFGIGGSGAGISYNNGRVGLSVGGFNFGFGKGGFSASGGVGTPLGGIGFNTSRYGSNVGFSQTYLFPPAQAAAPIDPSQITWNSPPVTQFNPNQSGGTIPPVPGATVTTVRPGP